MSCNISHIFMLQSSYFAFDIEMTYCNWWYRIGFVRLEFSIEHYELKGLTQLHIQANTSIFLKDI